LGGRQRYQFEEAISYLDQNNNTIGLLAPIKVVAEAVNSGTIIIVNLEANTVTQLECSCCLSPIIYPLQLNLQLSYCHQQDLEKMGIMIAPGEESEDYQVFAEKPVNIKDLVLENFLISLPMKPLCRVDCQGLCPECGEDLNQGTCICKEKVVDPRLEVLRGLLGTSD